MTANNKNIDKQGKKLLNVPNLRFPEFEGEWEKDRIRNLFTINVGGDIDKKNVSETQTDKYPYPIIANALSNDGIYGYTSIYKDSAPCITVTGRGDIGSAKFRNYPLYPIVRLLVLHSNGKIDCCFGEYAINHIRKYEESTGVPQLTSPQLGAYSICYPSFEEQIKIGDFLNLIDKRIATQNRIIEDLKQLRSAITNRIIYNLVADKKFVPFSAIYQMAGEGGTPNTNNRQYYEGGTIPFIKIDDLSSKYLTRNKDFITEIGLQKSSAWVIPANSLIYSNGATIGAVSINTYKVATKQGILGIVPKSTVCVEYLYYLTTSTFFKKQIHRIITHGTMTTAYLKDINKIKVPLPDIEEQNKVIKGLITLSEKIEKEQEILANFQAQKKYLLHQMFI